MSIYNPIIRPKSYFSIRENLNYYANSYLNSGTICTITKSTTVNNKNYHLVEIENHKNSSYILTALRIVSYFTLILPTLAFLTSYLTSTKNNVYYNQKGTGHNCVKQYFPDKAPLNERVAVAKALDNLGFMTLGSNTHFGFASITLLEAAIQNYQTETIRAIFQANPNIILSQKDSPFIQDYFKKNFRYGYGENQHLEIGKMLISGTQGDCLKDFEDKYLIRLLFKNPLFCQFINSDPNLSRIVAQKFSVTALWDGLMYENGSPEEWRSFHQSFPDLFRMTNSQRETLLSKALERHSFSEGSKLLIHSIIEKDPDSLLLNDIPKHIWASVRDISIDQLFFSQLWKATTGRLQETLDERTLLNLKCYAPNILNYLISHNNPHPLKPDLKRLAEEINRGETRSSHSSSNGSSSFASNNTQQDQQKWDGFLRELRGILGSGMPDNIESKQQLHKLIIKNVMPKIHPNKVTRDNMTEEEFANKVAQADERTKLVNGNYENIKKLALYINLPD